jgi:hypothetical protein
MSLVRTADILIQDGSQVLRGSCQGAPLTIYGLQFDAASPLPFVPSLQALYFNGAYAHKPVTYGRGRVWIDVTGDAPRAAMWLDVESGDATPAMIPPWLAARHAAGLGDGGIYCGRATLPEVLRYGGMLRFGLWLATLDGTTTPPDDVVLPPHVTLLAVQAFPASMLGFNADLSVVTDASYWIAHAQARPGLIRRPSALW